MLQCNFSCNLVQPFLDNNFEVSMTEMSEKDIPTDTPCCMGVSPFIRENATGEYLANDGTARLYGIDFCLSFFYKIYSKHLL